MTGPRCGGRKGLLWLCGRAKREAGTSGKVQSGHDKIVRGGPGAAARRPKGTKRMDNRDTYII